MNSMLKRIFWLASICLSLLLSGCATKSADNYGGNLGQKDVAVVLVGLNSEVPLGGATSCFFCPTLEFGGRKDVYAYPVSVGGKFNILSVGTMDMRIAHLKGGELSVDKPGVYYYGTVIGNAYGVSISRGVNVDMLLAAKRKYGARFDNLAANGFSWPDPSRDSRLAFGYQVSPVVQAALQAFNGRRLRLASLTMAPAKLDLTCRASGVPIALPNFLPYEEYVRRAFNLELATAGLYDESPDSTALTGSITDLSLATWNEPHWLMAIRLSSSPDLAAASSRVVAPFVAVWNAGLGCAAAEDAVPVAVRKLLEDLVVTTEFKTLVTSPRLAKDGAKPQ